MKITVTLQTDLTIEFDENSDEFKEMFDGYRRYISDDDYEDFANNISRHIARYGASDFIEGVGHVKINGEYQNDWSKEGCPIIECPVNVIGDFDMNDKCDFEIFSTNTEDGK